MSPKVVLGVRPHEDHRASLEFAAAEARSRGCGIHLVVVEHPTWSERDGLVEVDILGGDRAVPLGVGGRPHRPAAPPDGSALAPADVVGHERRCLSRAFEEAVRYGAGVRLVRAWSYADDVADEDTALRQSSAPDAATGRADRRDGGVSTGDLRRVDV